MSAQVSTIILEKETTIFDEKLADNEVAEGIQKTVKFTVIFPSLKFSPIQYVQVQSVVSYYYPSKFPGSQQSCLQVCATTNLSLATGFEK